MAANGFLNTCRFTPAAGGTADFAVSAVVTGYKTPAQANAVNGTNYSYRAESSDLSQWEEGEGGYTSATTTLARTTITASSSAGAKVNFSSAPQVAVVTLTGDLPIFTSLFTIHNASLAVSAGSSALTIALKDAIGNDPSAASPVIVNFRNSTGTTGTPSALSITGATSLVISSGSTMGVTSTTAFRIWVVLFNDAGTARLGAINCSPGGGNTIYPLSENVLASSTAEGGAGAADSAGVFYTGSAVTSKAYRILGFLEWNTSGLTAGTWTTSNLSLVQSFGPGIPTPGKLVQYLRTNSTAVATGTTTIPADDTIPQISEGDEYLSQAITPTSAVNAIRISAIGLFASTGTGHFIAALFQDATSNALASVARGYRTADDMIFMAISHSMRASTASSTTIRFRAGLNNMNTTTFNGASGTRQFGGTAASSMTIEEIQG